MTGLAGRIAGAFDARFPTRDPGHRLLGREAEFPVVHPDGNAADISPLWRRLADGRAGGFAYDDGRVVAWRAEGVEYTAEVGRGTIEVIVGPLPTVMALDDAMEAAVAHLVRAAEAEGLRVLGYGVQPAQRATGDWMTPKPRYRVLHEVIGDDWLSFALTAADQVHVDVARDEVVPVTNLLNALAPVVVALCANSPVAEGAWTGVLAWRSSAMGRIGADHHRHGMPEGPVDDLAGWVRRTLPMPYLMDKVDGVPRPVDEPFEAWAAGQALGDEALWDRWLLHEHYIWNAARPRAAHGTVEIRGACQQPWAEHGAVAALSAGLVCGHAEIATFVAAQLGEDAWPALRSWYAAAVTDGAAADEPVPGLMDGVLDRAASALAARGHGEEAALDPVRARWQARRSPAHAAREAFASGGLAALVAHTAL